MAYAEKRGRGPQPWRVKYKLPDGTEVSESGFETKAAALTWGRDQEARISHRGPVGAPRRREMICGVLPVTPSSPWAS
jgi:hypothetical protein